MKHLTNFSTSYQCLRPFPQSLPPQGIGDGKGTELTKHCLVKIRTTRKDGQHRNHPARYHCHQNAPPPHHQPSQPPHQVAKEEQERKLDRKQRYRQQHIRRQLEPHAPLQQRDKFRSDDRAVWVYILLDVEIRDCDVEGYGAGDQGDDGEEEEGVVEGDCAGLDDTDVGTSEGQGESDASEEADGGLLGVS